MKLAAALDRHMKWLLFAPAVIVMVVIFVYPVVYAVNLSLHDWNMFTMTAPPFVLFQNYATAFKDRELWAALTKTAIFVAGGVTLQFIVGMLLAMGVDRLTRQSGLLTTLIVMPMMVTPVVVGLKAIAPLADPKLALLTVTPFAIREGRDPCG